jgi:proteic killer suppression protein
MIKSFKDRETERLFRSGQSRRIGADLQHRAMLRLRRVDLAERIEDLLEPPSHMLEKLSGDRQGSWSIRVNRQWRICFRWQDGHAWDVEMIDYH